MNKEISVQYAYKKDGKGERHGDEAERMLAAQARKHNVQPTIQPLPPQLFQAQPPPMSHAMINGTGANGLPGPPPGFMPNGNYQNAPQAPARPPPAPLAPPPSGLPARPPPSQAGYGGPAGMLPPGFAGAPMAGNVPGFPPQAAPPAGFAPPLPLPPGFAPPPPGMGMTPPGLPPGFQQQAYGRR